MSEVGTVAPLMVQADLEHRLKKDTVGEILSSDVNIERALEIKGWMSEPELRFLASVAKNSKLIYEIGSYAGRSTRAMADNTKGVIHAIDTWKEINYDGYGNAVVFVTDNTIFNLFYCNLRKYLDSGKVIPSFTTWADFPNKEKADLIFIDGDHRYESVKKDIRKAMDLIKPYGIIAGHDYQPYWPGVVQAADETFGKVNVVDTIWWVRTV